MCLPHNAWIYTVSKCLHTQPSSHAPLCLWHGHSRTKIGCQKILWDCIFNNGSLQGVIAVHNSHFSYSLNLPKGLWQSIKLWKKNKMDWRRWLDVSVSSTTNFTEYAIHKSHSNLTPLEEKDNQNANHQIP